MTGVQTCALPICTTNFELFFDLVQQRLFNLIVLSTEVCGTFKHQVLEIVSQSGSFCGVVFTTYTYCNVRLYARSFFVYSHVDFQTVVQRVETTAVDLEIQSLRNRSLHALSGGEKQKVAFASVYAMNPDIYLLDEPSSNLDMDAIQDLRKHLKFVKQQGKTILIAEHRLYYLMDVADRKIGRAHV